MSLQEVIKGIEKYAKAQEEVRDGYIVANEKSAAIKFNSKIIAAAEIAEFFIETYEKSINPKS